MTNAARVTHEVVNLSDGALSWDHLGIHPCIHLVGDVYRHDLVLYLW